MCTFVPLTKESSSTSPYTDMLCVYLAATTFSIVYVVQSALPCVSLPSADPVQGYGGSVILLASALPLTGCITIMY